MQFRWDSRTVRYLASVWLTHEDLATRFALSSYFLQVISGQVATRIKQIPRNQPITTRLFGSVLHAYDYGVQAYLVSELFLQRIYDVGVLPEHPVIVDCGANIGIATFFFVHAYPGCNVLAFEPDPMAYELLERNVTENHWSGVETENMALDRTEGTLELYYDPNDFANVRTSGIPERLTGTSREVRSVRLSSRIPAHVDLLKIDVEGMEWAILDDLEQADALSRVDRLAIEYHHHLPEESDRLSEFLGRLEKGGFGYQVVASPTKLDLSKPHYQDIMVYGYRKG